EPLRQQKPDLAILISCVGRRLVLQKRIDEEVHAAKEIFGGHTTVTGFYSYGEISPLKPGSHCELHNQTMTITTFSES
ncbi:MAG TPA: FIST C-terminal domain-containing protein, partial [Chitinophagaceae bacterium]